MAGTLGGKPGGGHGAIVGINVTPMVDVVLVLLVIMMVSATYIVSQSLKVELPKAASSNEAVQSLAAVTLTKDGKIYFNQQPIAEPDLIKKFKEGIAANEDMSLIVSADKEVSHGQVVHIIDIAKIEGILKFAINVESAK